MSNKINKANNAKSNIKRVSDSLYELWNATRDDRAKLFKWEAEKDFQIDINGLIDVYSGDIDGYASALETSGSIRNPEEAVERLKRYGLLQREDIGEWYADQENGYEKLKEFVEKLDYLRLLILEYITIYQSPEQKE